MEGAASVAPFFFGWGLLNSNGFGLIYLDQDNTKW